MDYVLEERIGNPDLFTGRKEELAYFLKWINDIKERKSQGGKIRLSPFYLISPDRVFVICLAPGTFSLHRVEKKAKWNYN
jgi:hypothetical protein